MVDILIDWQRHEFGFAGETVAMELRPMETGAVFKLMTINRDAPDEHQLEVMAEIFSAYVRNIENLTVNGKPVTAEQIARVTQLMSLAGDIMVRLTEISQLSKAEEKNSSRQSTFQAQSGKAKS